MVRAKRANGLKRVRNVIRNLASLRGTRDRIARRYCTYVCAWPDIELKLWKQRWSHRILVTVGDANGCRQRGSAFPFVKEMRFAYRTMIRNRVRFMQLRPLLLSMVCPGPQTLCVLCQISGQRIATTHARLPQEYRRTCAAATVRHICRTLQS